MDFLDLPARSCVSNSIQEKCEPVPNFHPTIGPLMLVDQPLRFSKAELVNRSHPPLLGEHTVEILKEIGISKDEIGQLRAKRVIG